VNARLYLILALVFGAQATFSQMPPQSGTLEIKSEPTGASVTIDGTRVTALTNTSLVVAPGKYTVSVGDKGGNPNCAPQSVTVRSNETKVMLCNATSWTSN
jgi:PEGA domain